MSSRLAEVAPERLAGWVSRFEDSHGRLWLAGDASPSRLDLAAEDGSHAQLSLLWSPDPGPVPVPADPPDVSRLAAELAAAAAVPRTVLIVLVRRGGWGVGLARGGDLVEGVSGTRYVQSRTAAGGWSQQRYARRRAGQAAGLVEAATERLVRLVAAGAASVDPPQVLAVGGDRGLVNDVIGDARLHRVAALAQSPLLDVADPRRRVLEEVARRVRSVRVRVDDSDSRMAKT